MIKNLVIAVLLVVVALFLFTQPSYIDSTPIIKIDTFYKDTTIEKWYKGDSIPYKVIDTFRPENQKIDTNEILKKYFELKVYSDTIRIDTNNYVYLLDTISKNSIIGRSFIGHFTEKTIDKTTYIERQTKNALYVGFLTDFRADRTLDGIGIGAMFRVKNKALIGLNIKSGQSVKYGIGFYLKL
jgi:hypothetical protein